MKAMKPAVSQQLLLPCCSGVGQAATGDESVVCLLVHMRSHAPAGPAPHHQPPRMPAVPARAPGARAADGEEAPPGSPVVQEQLLVLQLPGGYQRDAGHKLPGQNLGLGAPESCGAAGSHADRLCRLVPQLRGEHGVREVRSQVRFRACTDLVGRMHSAA